MNVIEYDKKYLNSVKDLLVELEEYILTLDEDELDQLHPDYYEKMANICLKEAYENDGKCFLAIENNKVVGLIIGKVREYSEYDYLDYTCPKEGEITQLIVTSNIRSKGIGKSLIKEMEKYFKSIDCKYIILDVFAYNKNGIRFYEKEGYHSRMYTEIKKID